MQPEIQQQIDRVADVLFKGGTLADANDVAQAAEFRKPMRVIL